jgi:hypothetical protein
MGWWIDEVAMAALHLMAACAFCHVASRLQGAWFEPSRGWVTSRTHV